MQSNKRVVEVLSNKKIVERRKEMIRIILCLVMVAVVIMPELGYSASTDAAELDDVWNKLKVGIAGTYGKIASLGIVIASIWNRERIGMMGMGGGIIIGVMIPTVPAIIDKLGTVTF